MIFVSVRGNGIRLALAVAATYAAFLLCAQFGFLAQVEKVWADDPRALHAVLSSMGLGGLGGSLIAARVGRAGSLARQTRWGLVSVAMACGWSQAVAGFPGALSAAAALGMGIGFLTVRLAGSLDRWVSRPQAVWVAATGTGAAYAFSNLPWFFSGTPSMRALAPAALCLVAAACVPPEARPTEELAALTVGEGRRGWGSFPGWVLAFAALVAVDSAAFAHLQRVPRLLEVSWGTPLLALRQGLLHALGAVAAGLLFDRRRAVWVLLAVALMFGFGLPLLATAPGSPAVAGAVLYALGIGVYSAALVAAPTAVGGSGAPRRAAWLYSIAGWLASGLGVAVAQSAGTRTLAWIGAGGIGLFLAWELGRHRLGLRRSSIAAGVAVVVMGLVALGYHDRLGGPGDPSELGGADPIARGRLVYLAEGCQHCHSQFVRPGTHDEIWWGPAAPFDRDQRPPTPGNRRLGPDLMMVGLRRSSIWQEAHLRAPARLSPGSRMPAYERLFADSRGNDLVAYLSSLGASQAAARQSLLATLPPLDPASPPDPARGGVLFARHCAPCHGRLARGDGGALGVDLPNMDLTKGTFARLPATDSESSRRAGLARIVRFGLPPGLMPGHEWLREQEVGDLVAFVLQRSRVR